MAETKKNIVKYDHNTGDIDNNITDSYVAGYIGTTKHSIDKKFIALITFAVLLLIVGIVLIILANVNSCNNEKAQTSGKVVGGADVCDPSVEADRAKLKDFMIKIQDVYHEVFPEEIAWMPEVTSEIIKSRFKVHCG